MDFYDLLEDAIYYAAQHAAELGADGTERIALVYEQDGKFRFTAPTGSGKGSSAKARIAYPRGAIPRALVHNHPSQGSGGQEWFSPEDIQQAKALGLPSYIAYGDAMDIAEYHPGRSPVMRRMLPGSSRNVAGSRGDPFPHIPEVKPAGQRIGDAKALARALRGDLTYGR